MRQTRRHPWWFPLCPLTLFPMVSYCIASAERWQVGNCVAPHVLRHEQNTKKYHSCTPAYGNLLWICFHRILSFFTKCKPLAPQPAWQVLKGGRVRENLGAQGKRDPIFPPPHVPLALLHAHIPPSSSPFKTSHTGYWHPGLNNTIKQKMDVEKWRVQQTVFKKFQIQFAIGYFWKLSSLTVFEVNLCCLFNIYHEGVILSLTSEKKYFLC